jgi:O-methyltransferase
MNIRQYPLVSEQLDYTEITIILRELERVLQRGVKGAVVEFGCYEGTASLFMQRLLQEYNPVRPLHVYDSFSGLPPKSSQDQSPAGEQFTEGALTASKARFIQHFRQAGLALPTIHKNWFDQLTDTDVPATIAFAFLDGDYYKSIKDSLRLITPHLQPGARIIVDDYQSEALPGARKAVDEWLGAHPSFSCHAEHSLAVITIND